eukprot:Sdes_comp20517_c0_seq6m15081
MFVFVFRIQDDRIGDQQQQQGNNSLKLKKAWDIALAPGKSIPMNAFMMYMAGNTVHIFSIMITGMMFLNPMKALFSVSQSKAHISHLLSSSPQTQPSLQLSPLLKIRKQRVE